jgi:hypothetical protein
MDSTCPRCREEEADLGHILRTCPELESPRRRNLLHVPSPLSFMTTDEADAAQYFRKAFDWDLP